MTKTLSTIVEDIYAVITDKGGWDETVNEYFLTHIGETMMSRLASPDQPRGTLRMSSIGQPCARRLWYSVNMDPTTGEPLRSATHLLFLYGDILEDLILALAVAAGHSVEGRQDELEVLGVKGHRDAVIDGVTIDVKSASPFSFKKFKGGLTDADDGFGYLGQLPGYVHAAKDDPLVTDKDTGAFLVINKVNGELCLDVHDFKKDGRLDEIEDLYASRIESSGKPTPPSRGFSPQPDGKSGNEKLGFNCSYCEYKKTCHPGLRTFLYAGPNGAAPRFLTTVVNEPKVMEVKDE